MLIRLKDWDCLDGKETRTGDPLLGNQEGQAFLEYILIIAVLVSFYVMVTSAIDRMDLARKLTTSITGPFAATYRYGNPKAKGYDDGGPAFHPRAYGGEENFRIFINPESN